MINEQQITDCCLHTTFNRWFTSTSLSVVFPPKILQYQDKKYKRTYIAEDRRLNQAIWKRRPLTGHLYLHDRRDHSTVSHHDVSRLWKTHRNCLSLPRVDSKLGLLSVERVGQTTPVTSELIWEIAVTPLQPVSLNFILST